MYNQNRSNTGKWIFFGIIFVSILSLFVGIQVGQAKWLSKPIAQAEAQKIENETSIQTQKEELDLELKEKQTEIAIKELDRQETIQAAKEQAKLERQVMLMKISNAILIGISILVGLAILAAIIIYSIKLARAGPQKKKGRRRMQELEKTISRIARRNETLIQQNEDYQQEIQQINYENELLSQQNKLLLERLYKGGEDTKYDDLPLVG